MRALGRKSGEVPGPGPEVIAASISGLCAVPWPRRYDFGEHVAVR